MTSRTSRLRGAVGAGAILLIGVAAGIVLDRTVLTPPSTQAAPTRDHARFVESLTAELGLTPTQTVAVREILDRHQETVTQAWENTHRTLMAALDSVAYQIEAVLEPGQVDRYHAWIERMHPPGDPRRPSHEH